MCEQQDIEARRAQDLKRWHRRVADRRTRGKCIRCGKRPPEPHRSDCEPCAEKRRKADLERHHRRIAERTALGLCPRCGKQPPAPERFLCEPCGEKRNRASRALHKVRQAAGRRRPRVLRAVPGEEAGGGPREIRRRESRRVEIRRGQPGRQEKERPRQEQAPPEGEDRGGALYPLRQTALDRGRNHLPALPRQEAGGGAPEILRPAPGRALHPVRSGGDRRAVALHPMCRHRGGQLRPRAEERALAQALRRTEGQGPLHGVRSALPSQRKLAAGRDPDPRLRTDPHPPLRAVAAHVGPQAEPRRPALLRHLQGQLLDLPVQAAVQKTPVALQRETDRVRQRQAKHSIRIRPGQVVRRRHARDEHRRPDRRRARHAPQWLQGTARPPHRPATRLLRPSPPGRDPQGHPPNAPTATPLPCVRPNVLRSMQRSGSVNDRPACSICAAIARTALSYPG